MFIHTVENGDTVFKIARKYATSPMKIIENNALENPDMLSVGEQLLILTPTRTYTVRGADTLARIARRFGVRRELLLANNPYLCGEDKTYPSEVLAIKYDAPTFGAIAANGYCFKGYDPEKLRRAIPYLTYLTVASVRTDGEKIERLFDDTPVIEVARNSGRIALMRAYIDRDSDFYGKRDDGKRLIDMLIGEAKARGYGGITLAAPRGGDCTEGYCEFLLEMRKRLIGCDLILFTEVDLNTEGARADLADASVLMYSKCQLDDIPSFEAGERRVFEQYAEEYESGRAFIDLPAFAVDGDDVFEISGALNEAHRGRHELENDKEKKILSFDYTHFKGTRGERRKMRFESVENVKAKLELVSELGYMGVSLDVSRTPVSTLMMMHSMFYRADMPSVGYDDM